MKRGADSQLYKGLAELAVLAAVRKTPRYGLELLSALTEHSGLLLGEGTIYPLLHRLEKERLVSADWRVDTPNGRPRKYYSITAAGCTALKQKADSWRRVNAKLDDFLKDCAL